MNPILPFLIAVGTYTVNNASEGIYILELDASQQKYHVVETLAADNPSFLQYSDKTSTLYYVEERASGTINAASFDRNTKELQRIASFSTEGSSPCHIAISPNEKSLIVSNYSSGNFSTFNLKSNGDIDRKSSSYSFISSGIHPERQEKSHVHSAFYTPSGDQVFVQDLGGDHIYQFGAEDIIQDDNTFKAHDMSAGSGPRHVTFSADNQYVYIINELNGTIDVYNLDENSKINSHLQNIVTDSRAGESMCAHILLSSDGRFLYASNRAEKNSISVFTVQVDGTLRLLQTVSSEGQGPRHFEFSSDGNWLIVANQQSNNLSLFSRDQHTGLLSFSKMTISIPSPVSVVIL
jgi:6-phosphogluconolactonase